MEAAMSLSQPMVYIYTRYDIYTYTVIITIRVKYTQKIVSVSSVEHHNFFRNFVKMTISLSLSKKTTGMSFECCQKR